MPLPRPAEAGVNEVGSVRTAAPLFRFRAEQVSVCARFRAQRLNLLRVLISLCFSALAVGGQIALHRHQRALKQPWYKTQFSRAGENQQT